MKGACPGTTWARRSGKSKRPSCGCLCMARRFLIIANPIAGGGRGGKVAAALLRQLEARGLEAEPYLTSKAGDARSRAGTAGREGWDGVISVGGDGTANEVVNGLRDLDLPIAVMAVGTGNVLARALGLPRNPAGLARVIDAGHTMSAAVGRANDRRFLLFAGAGLEAAMVQRFAQVRRRRLSLLSWIVPILHVVRRWPRFELSAELEDGTVLNGLSAVLVTRVRNYGVIMRLPQEIDIGDGKLHVLGFQQRTRSAWLAAALRGLTGRLRPGRDCILVSADRLRIWSAKPTPYEIDGDHVGETPLTICLEPQSARLFCPLV